MKHLNVRKTTGKARTSLLFILFVLVTPVLPAQLPRVKITLEIRNKPVSDILDDISGQTGYYFTYDSGLFPSKNRLSYAVQDLYLASALDSLFHDSTLTYRLIDKNIVIYRKNRVRQPAASPDSAVYRRIKGVIVDDRSGKPLPFASIALYGTNKGTITNESGEFALNIPPGINDALLTVSYIGYHNQYKAVPANRGTDITIRLAKDVISLQEVIIRYQDPADLLDEAIAKIPDNYLNQNSLMTAYYRENVQRNKKVLLFSEAVLDILKYSYNGSTPDEKVKIIKGRKFMDVTDEDTVLMKIKSGIRSSFDLDIVKSLPYFLTADNHHLFDYEFSDIVSYKNQMVYVVNFHQKPQIKEALFTGDIYLDMDNLTILAADFQLDPRYIGQETSTFVIRKSPRLKIKPLSAIYHVEYRKSAGGYHLGQVRGEVRFKMRKRKKWIASLYSLKIEMAVTDVEPGFSEKFRNNETINTGVILSDQDFTPDAAFWGDYNTIEPEASLTDVLKKMGKQQTWNEDFGSAPDK